MAQEIKKIGECEICMEKDAKYFIYKDNSGGFMNWYLKIWKALVCKECLEKIKSGEIPLN